MSDIPEPEGRRLFRKGIRTVQTEDAFKPFGRALPVQDIETGEWIANVLDIRVDIDYEEHRHTMTVRTPELVIELEPERVTVEQPAIESLSDDREMDRLQMRNHIRQLENELAGQEEMVSRYRREVLAERAAADTARQNLSVTRRTMNDQTERIKRLQEVDFIEPLEKELRQLADRLRWHAKWEGEKQGAVSWNTMHGVEVAQRMDWIAEHVRDVGTLSDPVRQAELDAWDEY